MHTWTWAALKEILMRRARIRDEESQSGAYYHIMNRTAGTRDDRPFDDVEKEEFVKLLHRLATFYTIEIIGYCAMSNHWHALLWVPHEIPSETEAIHRFTRFYPRLDAPDPGTPEMEHLRNRLRDLSDLGKQLQMRFTAWYNRTRPIERRGGLWADRFKSVLLQGSRDHSAIWSCLAYIELNPVRANLVDDPADYRFSSWGRYCGSGQHPFKGNFTRHLQRTAMRGTGSLTASEIVVEFRAKLAEAIELDRSGDRVEAAAVAEEARATPSVWVRADRRVRFWSNGAVIGSKAFVQEQYARQYGNDKATQHRYGRGAGTGGSILFSMRRPSPEA
jgi:putative transposase